VLAVAYPVRAARMRGFAALARACDLGVAMQLTNIARDVGEDARAGRLYLPLDWLLHKFHLHHFVHVPGGFEKGAAHMLLTLPNLPPAVPLICYEAIFPEEAVPASLPGMPSPGFMLNVTDDGWFGRTSGPYQHFAQARLTAIEQGLPLLRAANTGISAIVDPYGRILGQLPLGEEGVIDGVLPGKIAAPPFARAPVLAGLLAWIGALLLALGLRALV